ncbi:MAG: hypothetical protein U0670_17480 [Anaerolineae bacterium]
MKIVFRYRAYYGIALLLMGALQLLLAYTRLNRGSDSSSQLVLGVTGMLLGAYFYYMPVATIDHGMESGTITLSGLFGIIKRTFTYTGAADLKIENNRLYYRQAGTWKSAYLSRSICRTEDWEKLEALIAGK